VGVDSIQMAPYTALEHAEEDSTLADTGKDNKEEEDDYKHVGVLADEALDGGSREVSTFLRGNLF